MCIKKQTTVHIPEKHELCKTPNSGCRFVEVKIGRKKWEMRDAVVIRTEGEMEVSKLYIYDKGKDTMGQCFSLDKLKRHTISSENGFTIIKLEPRINPKLTFRIKTEEGQEWLTALQSMLSGLPHALTSLDHKTHPQIRDGDPMKDLQEEPDNNAYTGSREVSKKPDKQGSGSDGKKAKESDKHKKTGEDKSADKKTKSEKKLKSVESKTKNKQSTTESGKNEKVIQLAKTQSEECHVPKVDEDLRKSESDPNVKKTQETLETSAKGVGKTPDPKLPTPTSQTPVPGLTPTPTPTPAGHEEKVKTATNSDENEPPPEKKK
ncbi:unnamed protein product [Caenorhabditis brenneri]